jgi:hypothetical protein
MDVIRELCSFEGRLAGTDAERRAANWLVGRLRGAGRRAEVEPTHVHPQYALVEAAHCALGFAGSLAAIPVPALGFAIVLATAVSMYLDVNARFYLLRRLFFRRSSQNVVSPGKHPEAPARVFLCAHYDAARTGAAFDPKRVARATRLAHRSPVPLGPFRVLFWSLAVLLPVLGARMAGVDSGLLSLLQLLPTIVLLVGVFLLTDIELSDVVPAANDNASGVATVLSVAEELDAQPPQNLDVWVVLTGGGECLMEGMRAFVRSRRRELDRDSTYFVVLDSVGRGTIRYETGEGPAVTYEMDRRLVQLCEAISAADREDGNRYRAEAHRNGVGSDALPPRLAKLRATTITCLENGALAPANYHRPEDRPDRLDEEALDRAQGFAVELVRAIDGDVGRLAAR